MSALDVLTVPLKGGARLMREPQCGNQIRTSSSSWGPDETSGTTCLMDLPGKVYAAGYDQSVYLMRAGGPVFRLR
jgi:hypothetical protein